MTTNGQATPIPNAGGAMSEAALYEAVWVPEPPARWCVRCSRRLSRYNDGDTCLWHTASHFRNALCAPPPRVVCKVCGVTAVGDGKRTCQGCLKAERAARDVVYRARRTAEAQCRRKGVAPPPAARGAAKNAAVPVLAFAAAPRRKAVARWCASCGVAIRWQGPYGLLCGDCVAHPMPAAAFAEPTLPQARRT